VKSQSGYTARNRPPNVLVAMGRPGGRDARIRGLAVGLPQAQSPGKPQPCQVF